MVLKPERTPRYEVRIMTGTSGVIEYGLNYFNVATVCNLANVYWKISSKQLYAVSLFIN